MQVIVKEILDKSMAKNSVFAFLQKIVTPLLVSIFFKEI